MLQRISYQSQYHSSSLSFLHTTATDFKEAQTFLELNLLPLVIDYLVVVLDLGRLRSICQVEEAHDVVLEELWLDLHCRDWSQRVFRKGWVGVGGGLRHHPVWN